MSKILFACGGTGGHIYPAIAIADRIKKSYPDAEILFMGTKRGMENRIVSEAGYPIEGIDASGFDRKNLLKNFKTLADLIKGRRETAAVLDKFKPDIAIGTGGYVTGAVLSEAAKKGVPYYIQEQNAFPGMANRMLAKGARKIFVSYEASKEAFAENGAKCVLTGNPIRSDFSSLDREKCRAELGIGEGPAVLATGGSLGAEILDRAVLKFAELAKGRGATIFFVTGKRYYEDIKNRLSEIPGALDYVRLIDYADNMPSLMTAADLIISRAGAIALSEICVCGRASILIPSPNVTNNHQFYNAKAMADAGASVMIEDKELEEAPEKLAAEVFELLGDRSGTEAMARAAKKSGLPDAADRIFDELELKN